MFDFAKIGLRSMRVAPSSPSPSTGFTTPTVIFESQRDINLKADALNADVLKNVTRDVFKAAWKGWYDNWKTFFAKYQSGTWQGDWNKASTLLYSDDLSAQTEKYRAELIDWYSGYALEKAPDGSALPPSTTAPPALKPPPKPDGEESGFTIPWWGWMLGGVAVVGGGYLLYQYAMKMKKMRQALDERVLPGVLTATMGPVGGQLMGAANYANYGRDPMAMATYVQAPYANHMHAVAPNGIVSPYPAPFPHGYR